MGNKQALITLGLIVATFATMFVLAGGLYLVGNIMIGWSWLTFESCIGVTGTLILIAGMILICILERKDKSE